MRRILMGLFFAAVLLHAAGAEAGWGYVRRPFFYGPRPVVAYRPYVAPRVYYGPVYRPFVYGPPAVIAPGPVYYRGPGMYFGAGPMVGFGVY